VRVWFVHGFGDGGVCEGQHAKHVSQLLQWVGGCVEHEWGRALVSAAEIERVGFRSQVVH